MEEGYMKAPGNKNVPSVLSHVFEGRQCRTVLDTRTNVLYVCLPDLLAAMGTTRSPNKVLPEIEEVFGGGGTIRLPIPDALGRIQETAFVSEPAASFVISRARTEASKRLNRWLFGEVLPRIHKTGGYILGEEHMDENQVVARTLSVLNRKLEEMNRQFAEQQPKVETYDQLMSVDGTFSFRTTARMLELGESDFLARLHGDGYLTKEEYSHPDKKTGEKTRRYKNTPYSRHREAGLFTVKLQRSPTNTWSWDQTYITAKGLDYFRLLYGSEKKTAA